MKIGNLKAHFFGRIPTIALDLTASEMAISFFSNQVKILKKYL